MNTYSLKNDSSFMDGLKDLRGISNLNITNEHDLTKLSIEAYNNHLKEEEVDILLKFSNDFCSEHPLTNSEMDVFLKRNKLLMSQILDEDVFIQENVNLITYGNGNPKSNFASNFKEIFDNDLKFKDKIKFNEFDLDIYIQLDDSKLEVFSEQYVLDAKFYIEEKYNLSCGNKDAFFGGLKASAREHSFNPLKDLVLDTQWDGVERVKTLFSDYLGSEDNEYTEMVSAKIMVGAVARVLNPGCKFDLMPILYGDQGIGKSYFVRQLSSGYVVEDLNKLNSDDKDEIYKLKSGWLVELPELSAFNSTDKEHAKGFITEQSNRYRELFSNLISIYKRHNVFIGTTNKIEFLNDESGNRRFLPVECGINTPDKSIFSNDENSLSYNLKQIYAEAVHMYKNGEKCYLTKDQERLANEYRSENEKHGSLFRYIDTYINDKFPRGWENYSEEDKYKFINSRDLDSNDTDLVRLNQVSTQDLLKFAIPKEYAEVHNINARKIKLVMSLVDGWTQSSNVQSLGKRTRGYKKIV